MARLQITRDRQRDKEQNKRGAQRAHTSQRCITLPAATMRAQSRLFAPPAARGLWVISPAHQGGQGRTDSRVGMYAPEAFSAERLWMWLLLLRGNLFAHPRKRIVTPSACHQRARQASSVHAKMRLDRGERVRRNIRPGHRSFPATEPGSTARSHARRGRDGS